jgi:isopenicillin-N epimerase
MATRREFLVAAGAAGLLGHALPARAWHGADVAGDDPGARPEAPPSGDLADIARDERYWRRVASRYRVARRPINLEAGYFGVMAAPVLDAFRRNVDRVNSEGAVFARRDYGAHLDSARRRTASFIGAEPGEVAFTRNATESLQALIGQYRLLRMGDAVMYADLDYGSMQLAMNALAARAGAEVVRVELPEPASRASVIATYEAALHRNPRTRLLLLTHANNKTGLVHPVREITALARARGVDVIVDAAHSFGHMPLTVADLDADFVGFNLHKWIGAPVGIGALYIRGSRLDAIGNAHGDETPEQRIDGRVHTGTTNFALMMTVPAAFDFQESVGMPAKAARLRYLRDRWVSAVRELPGVDVLTPDEEGMVYAITSFRLHGRGSREDNAALARALLDEFGVFTVQRNGLARGDCIRVTPAIYTMPADVDRLAEAIRALAGRGGGRPG